MSAEKEQQSTEPGGPAHGQGLEYQSLVTVWIAIDLIFKQKRALEIIIEPSSHEDIEVKLLDPLQLGQAGGIDELAIQVKIRDGQWPPSKLKEVLGFQEKKRGTRGPSPRKPAWKRLRDNRRQVYLLITSGKLPASLRALRVSDLLRPPAGVEPPDVIWPTKKGGPASEVAGRLGVLDDQLEALVEQRVERLLMTELSVPMQKVPGCIEKLKSRVRARLDGKEKSHLWTREQILLDVREFDGAPAYPELDLFVPPRGFEDMQRKLETENFLLLLGRSGAGKTFVAKKLRAEFQHRPEPFLIQKVTEPRQTDEAPAGGPILFVIEDPWGATKRGLYADLWVAELPRLLDGARPNRRFLVTSRIGSLRSVAGKESSDELIKRAFRLSYEDYGETERRLILRNELKNAQPWQQDFVRANESRIVESLRAPLSLHSFASSLKRATSKKQVDLDQLLRESGIRKIAGRIQREILDLDWDARAPALVLWSLLIGKETFSLAEASDRAEMLWSEDFSPEVERLVHWMHAAGHLVPEQDSYRAHPTTIAGLWMVLDDQPDFSRRLLGALLVRLLGTDSPRTALELAAHLGQHQALLNAALRKQVTERLKADLLFAPDDQFRQVLALALRWTEPDPVFAVVQGLTNLSSNRENVRFGVPRWVRPRWTSEILTAVRASVEARTVTERFIRLVLPLRLDFNPGPFSRWIRNDLGWDLSAIFREVLEKSIEKEGGAIEELVVGALSGENPPYELVLQKLFDKSDEIEREYREAKAAQVPDEDEDVDAPTLGEYYSDRFEPIGSGIEKLVRVRHEREGYQWIVEHPRCMELLRAWASLVTSGKPTELEFEAFMSKCSALDPGLAWRTLADARHESAVPELLKALGDAGEESLAECADSLLRVTSSDNVRQHLERVAPTWSLQQREEVAWAFRMARTHLPSQYQIEALTAPLIQGSQSALDACQVVYEERGFTEENRKSLSPEDLKTLERWAADRSSSLGQQALLVLAEFGHVGEALIGEELKSQDQERRVTAIRILSKMNSAWSLALLKAALSDESPACRVTAMKGLAVRTDAEGWHMILACASDPEQAVRMTIPRSIRNAVGAIPIADEAMATLCELLRDEEPDLFDFKWVENPVARAAADALSEFSSLAEAVFERLVSFLSEGLAANADVVVHERVLRLVQSLPRPAVTSLLMRLLGSLEASLPDSRQRALDVKVAEALLTHVENHPNVQVEPLVTVVNLAKHDDSDLAIPGLLVLGLLGVSAMDASRQAYEASIDRRVWRAFIVLMGFAWRGHPVQNHPASKVLPEGHPSFHLLEWLAPNPKVNAEEWSRRWAQYPAVLDWVCRLKIKDKWGRNLLDTLNAVFGEPFGDSIPV